MKHARTMASAARQYRTTAVCSTVQYLPKRVENAGYGRILCRTLIFLLCLTSAVAALAADRPIIKEVLISRQGNGARIEISANQPLTYRSYLMPALGKWVVDLPGAETTYSADESKKLRTPPLKRITVRQKEVNGDLLTRIGLDFNGEVNFLLRHDPLDKRHLVLTMTPLEATSSTKPE